MGRHSSSSSGASRSRSRSRSRRQTRTPPRQSGSRRRSHSGSADDGFRVHISDLPGSCSRIDLEKQFEKFGPLIEVWKTNNPPCFAFIVFRNKEDAEEAVREMNGRSLQVGGSRVRVSMALPRSRERQRQMVFSSDARCYQCGQPGHFSRNCRSYEGAGRNRMAPSPRFSNRFSDPRHHRNSSSKSRSRSRSRSRSHHRSRDHRGRDHRRSPERDDRQAHRSSRDSGPRDNRNNAGGDVDADDIIAAQMA